MSDPCGNVGGVKGYIYKKIGPWVYGQEPSLDPKYIAGQLGDKKVKENLDKRGGNIKFSQNYYSKEDKETVKMVQSAMVYLGVLKADKCEPRWWAGVIDGGYGNETREALQDFQIKAGIRYKRADGSGEIPNGNRINSRTVDALVMAVQAKSQGKNWKAEIKPKE